MNPTELLDDVRALLPGLSLESLPSVDQPTLGIPPGSIVDVCRVLRDRKGFLLLSDVTAVDWWPREPRYEVTYHLASTSARVRLTVVLHSESAHLQTIQDVWPAAGWLEREVWDLFGITFDGHGDLRRLLMPEDWEGHPLRKDYPVQIRLKPKSAEPLQISEEEFRANVLRDRNERRSDSAR